MSRQLPPTNIGPTKFIDYFYKPGQQYGMHNVPCVDMTGLVQASVLSVRMGPAVRGFVLSGEPGVGKTHLLVNAVTSIPSTAAMLLPNSMFGSKHEGGLVENFEAAMADAVSYSAFFRHHVAIILDDADASELSVGENTGHTTNANSFAGYLQNLLTSPRLHVDFMGKPIPLLFTVNDATKIRPSLFRDDRVTRAELTLDENARDKMIVAAFKPEGFAETRIVEKLIRSFRQQNMSFWAALVKDWKSHQVQAVIREHGPDQAALERLRNKRAPLDGKVLHALAAARRDATIKSHFKPQNKGLFS